MASPAALQTVRLHAPVLVSAAIVLIFGLFLASQINDWLQLMRAPLETSAEASQPAGVAPDLQRMETLFGTPATPSQGFAPGTSSSDLTLHGSFVHADPARSTAIIQLAGNPPQLYRLGQELEPGVSLQGVYSDRVEVLRGGRLESLYFPTTRSAAAISESLPDYSEPTEMEQLDPQAELLQQQMEALRQQMEGSPNPPDNLPSDEQPMEDD